MEGNTAIYVVAFLVACGFIVLIRYITLWFFNINTIISELQKNNMLLREIQDELRKMDAQVPSSRQN